MRLQHKSFPVTEIKASDDDQGVLEAIVSVFGIEDLGGDRVMPGAFTDSLARRRPYGCVYHDWNRPVARTLEAKELSAGDPLLPESIREYGGLYVKGQFNLDTQDGKETFSNLKAGLLDQFSIGYSIDPGGSRSVKGVNELTKVTLYEWSPVLWGMNEATVPLSVKGLQAKAVYLGDYAAEEMTLAALRDCCDSLFYRAIYTILFSYDGADRTADEKVSEIDAAIAEFHALCVQCLRAMLTAAEGDESAMEAEYKDVFSVPARAAGRLNEQLDAALAATKSSHDRFERYAALKESEGRLPSPDRREQLLAIHGAIGALLEKTAPVPPLDLDLFHLKASARRRRLLALGEGATL